MHTQAYAEQTQSSRNLCVFCDGTGAILGSTRATSLVRLAYASMHQPDQIVHYDAGVGTPSTLPAVGLWDSAKQRISRTAGLAFGDGIFQNIAEAYTFLIDHYSDRRELKNGTVSAGAVDQIFLFGFSRGAFTARAVGGMVAQFGIVGPEHRNLVDYMVRTYFAEDRSGINRDHVIQDIGHNFQKFPNAPRPLVHFVGTWDTVASVGMPGLSRSFSGRAQPNIRGKRFVHVRHAVSRHEYRGPFKVRLYSLEHDAGQSIEQRVFDGVHTDVGGGYEERGLGLSAQAWMTAEAAKHGLRLADVALAPSPILLHDEAYTSPVWALAGLKQRRFVATEFSTPIPPLPAVEHGDSSSVWQPLLTRPWFWGGLALAALFYLLASLMVQSCDAGFAVKQACTQIWIGAPSAQLPALRELLAAQPEKIGWFRWGLLFELFCMAASLMLVAVLLVHSRMSWLRSAAFFADRGELAFKAALGATWLWLLTDLAENTALLLGTRSWWWGPSAADRLGWLEWAHTVAYAKFAALAVLGAYFGVSVLARVLRRAH